jgi:hypothetical protein
MNEDGTPKGYDALMDIACPDWGFCGCIKNDTNLHVDLLIPSTGPVSADQFVEWLFLADDMNPNSNPEKWQRAKQALRDAFIDCMGADVVDASRLVWSNCEPSENTSHRKFRGKID